MGNGRLNLSRKQNSMPKTHCKMLKVYVHSRLNDKKWNPDGITGLIGKSIEGNKGENNSDLKK